RAREARVIAGGLSTRLDEVFHGINPVKLNRLEDYQAGRYGRLLKRRIRVETETAFGRALIPGLIDVMTGIGFIAVLFFGGQDIISGEKTVGEFMSFFTALALMFEPLRRLGAISGQWQATAASLERVYGLTEVHPSILSPARPAPPPDRFDIGFEDVHFAYEESPVLRGLSFTAEDGKTTALVGASGAGKSTVFNLLTRLVDPRSGQVKLGGRDVRDYALGDVRSTISVVTQDALLFDETLRENILLGKEDVPPDTLQAALDAAYVTEYLPKLSDGLNSPAGPRGSALSGGQRQRVAIARSLLKDAPVLLLDEATSALDAASERAVQDALDRLARGRTTLVIAHRLSTIQGADKIVVMDRGQVVDEGSHDELLARDGIYADLYRLQFRDPADLS
ncbi:MAG: ABC transporter ATP-binding protein, partial [Pseudomonadota bacterium]